MNPPTITPAAPPTPAPQTVTLIVEDGSGVPNANAYCDVPYADNYHIGTLNQTVWSAASTDLKSQAIIAATRTIDSNFTFDGWMTYAGADNINTGPGFQKLQFPRYGITRRDRAGGWNPLSGRLMFWGPEYWTEYQVPWPIMDATALQAYMMLLTDRMVQMDPNALNALSLGQNAISMTFNYAMKNRLQPITDEVQRLLSPFGVPRYGEGPARVLRTV
jgi:hypothetical protein